MCFVNPRIVIGKNKARSGSGLARIRKNFAARALIATMKFSLSENRASSACKAARIFKKRAAFNTRSVYNGIITRTVYFNARASACDLHSDVLRPIIKVTWDNRRASRARRSVSRFPSISIASFDMIDRSRLRAGYFYARGSMRAYESTIVSLRASDEPFINYAIVYIPHWSFRYFIVGPFAVRRCTRARYVTTDVAARANKIERRNQKNRNNKPAKLFGAEEDAVRCIM